MSGWQEQPSVDLMSQSFRESAGGAPRRSALHTGSVVNVQGEAENLEHVRSPHPVSF